MAGHNGMRPESGPTCKGCDYFKPTSERGGECRRYAPKPSRDHVTVSIWPIVKPDDWCGQHHQRGAAKS